MRVARSLVGGAVLVAFTVHACGGSGYQFVENEELGVYAKLPDGWAIYDETDLFPDESDEQLERLRATMWVRTFDASDHPSVKGSQSPGSAHPTGFVQVRQLRADEREQINLSALRGAGDPQSDPVAIAEQNSAVAVLLDEPVEFEGGFHGVHTVFAVSPEGEDTILTDRTILLDSASTTMFLFQVACEEQCFLDTHKDVISDVVDSWTIQEGE